MKKIRALRRWLFQQIVLAGNSGELKRETVKAMIPHSWFTKKGPGVEEDALRAFHDMNHGQKLLAVRAGWIPRAWLQAKL
jgi:hypothetical protein